MKKLDNLIVLYDSNDVTLDAMADKTQSENIQQRFEAYGWEVTQIDGHDIKAIDDSITTAKKSNNGKPKMIICRTIIGKGIDEVAGTSKAHGEGGLKFVEQTRKRLDLPPNKWFISESTKEIFAARAKELTLSYNKWQNDYADWKSENPEKAKILESAINKDIPSSKELFDKIPELEKKDIATREAGSIVLQHIAKSLPLYVTGSADLFSSCKNYIKDGGDFGYGEAKDYGSRNLHFGIREHAMGSIMNGFAYYGLFHISGSTFLTFADYMRAPVRLASLSELAASIIYLDS